MLASYLARIVRELGRPGRAPRRPRLRHRRRARVGRGHHRRLLRRRPRPPRGGGRRVRARRGRGRGGDEALDVDDDGMVARILVTREQAAAFAIRATQPGRGRPAAVPPVRPAARPLGPRLPAHQRPPTARHVTRRAEGDRPGDRDPDPDGPDLDGPGAAAVLLEGEMTVHGRIAGSSNATLLVTCDGRRHRAAGRLQARPGRAAAVGLPLGLHRREVAAYELSAALGWGLVPRPWPAPTAPSAPDRCSASSPRTARPHYFTLREDPRVAPRPGHHRRLRRAGQQRRPQERPRALGRGAALGHRQRPVLPHRGEAAHRHLGLRRRAPARPAPRRRRAPGGRGPARRSVPTSSTPTRPRPSAGGRPASSRRAACRCPTRTATGPPTPGRWCDRPGATMAPHPDPLPSTDAVTPSSHYPLRPCAPNRDRPRA